MAGERLREALRRGLGGFGGIGPGLRPPLTAAAALFSLNSFAAAMLALWIALSIGLERPFWAITTAYIVSQPLSGAAASKAVYRLMGTVLGGAATVAMVPPLVQSPPLLCLALSLWVGACLGVSLLDRTPRSYAAMLAGYTAAIIGFGSVNAPEAVFQTAVARTEEIGLGVICATAFHTLVFPRPVREAIVERVTCWVAEADRWALDVLRGAGDEATARDRRNLAAAAIDIQLLTIHLPFDTTRVRETGAAVRALHERMLLLIPLLSGVSDRLAELVRARPRQPLAPQGEAVLADTARWLEAGAPFAEGLALQQRLQQLTQAETGADWPSLVSESLYVRFGQAVRELADAHALLALVRDPRAAVPQEVAEATARAARRRPRGDPALAVWSGLTAAAAVLATCALWIGLGWPEGGAAAAMVAVFASFFAAIDDPAPAIANFGVFLLGGLPLAAFYLFEVLPSADGFPSLVLALAPAFLLIGLYMSDPRRAGPATAVIIGFGTALGIQTTYAADFASFVNGNVPQLVALLVAVFITRTMRSMGVEAAARRLLRRSWRELADVARGRASPDVLGLAAGLVDRVGQITPKLALLGESGGVGGADVLRDLRVGMNLANLQQLRPELAPEPRAELDALLAGVGEHYARRPVEPAEPGQELLAGIDRLLAAFAGSSAPADRSGAVSLVGLRRGLFPQSPPFRSAEARA
jgi:uncharacterized membrane protein YccC